MLWVVILTPVGCLVLYPLTRLLDKHDVYPNENGG